MKKYFVVLGIILVIAVTVVVMGCSGRVKDIGKTKWEYKIVNISRSVSGGTFNENEYKNILNAGGKEGWCFVEASSLPYSQCFLVFKRSLITDSAKETNKLIADLATENANQSKK